MHTAIVDALRAVGDVLQVAGWPAGLITREGLDWLLDRLLKAGSGEMTQKSLEQQCHLAAQRMNMLYGFDSPEFFDRSLFENFMHSPHAS